MKTKLERMGLALVVACQVSFAVPVLSGDGLGAMAIGAFGNTGTIFEYGVQGSAGLTFASSQSMGVDGLRLRYSFTATSALAFSSASVYLDAEINQEANTWFNERGEALVAAGGATSWEIDEPGFGVSYIGDIYANYLSGVYDNSVFGGDTSLVEDVALGLAFNFGSLGVGDRLDLDILIGDTFIGPGWGTVLHQWDHTDGLSGDNLYFAGRYSILRAPPVEPPDPPAPGAVPEPGTLALMGLGMLLFFAKRQIRS
jgi:PEP-CTERM motif